MARVITRLRLTTSRRPSYRRAGVKIGSLNAPTFVEKGDVTPEQGLAILRDPNVVVAVEDEEGGVHLLTSEELAEIEEGLLAALALEPPPTRPTGETDTDEPQGGGAAPAAEASQVGGHEATAADSTASAGGAVTPEPTAQADPAAPEPAAKPTRASRGGGKKAKGTVA